MVGERYALANFERTLRVWVTKSKALVFPKRVALRSLMLRIKTKSAENLRLGTEYNGQLCNAVTRQARKCTKYIFNQAQVRSQIQPGTKYWPASLVSPSGSPLCGGLVSASHLVKPERYALCFTASAKLDRYVV